MLLFTIISQIPYDLFLQSVVPGLAFKVNIGATLTVGLLALYTIENIKNPAIKIGMLMLLLILSIVIPMDYSYMGVLAIIAFYIFRNSRLLYSVAFTLIILLYCYINNSTFALPAVLALFPISLYNGKKGKDVKYLFYAFYPLHMLFITFLVLQ